MFMLITLILLIALLARPVTNVKTKSEPIADIALIVTGIILLTILALAFTA